MITCACDSPQSQVLSLCLYMQPAHQESMVFKYHYTQEKKKKTGTVLSSRPENNQRCHPPVPNSNVNMGGFYTLKTWKNLELTECRGEMGITSPINCVLAVDSPLLLKMFRYYFC